MSGTGAEMRRIPATLWLLFLIPVATKAATFRLEAELLLKRHELAYRESASGGQAIHVKDTSERLTFSFCLHRPLTANITAAYSNDGDSDDVRLKVHGLQRDMTFSSEAVSAHGAKWDEFKSVTFTGVSLSRGYHQLSVIFQALDRYGIEIDYVDVSVDDAFLNDDVFHCQLVIGAEPTFSADEKSGVTMGHVKQFSTVTPCPEEDNIHLSVYHDTVKQYKLTATDPLYRSMNDISKEDTSTCPNLDYVYWKFNDVSVSKTVDTVYYPANKAKLDVLPLKNDANFEVKHTVSFSLKGYKTGFIDADMDSDFNIELTASATSSPTIKVTYQGRDGQEKLLNEFRVAAGETEKKKLNIKEMQWSEDHTNYLNIYVNDKDTVLKEISLFRGYFYPDKEVEIYTSDALLLRGMRSHFWWRRPVGESLTVKVGNQTFEDLSTFILYVPSPWSGKDAYQQIFVLYQDGNVRLLPLPPSSPKPGYWIPFGTSVIVGKSDPTHLRPAASIKTMTFDPDTLEMTLTYYDKSTCKLALSYSTIDTSLTVKDIHFVPATSGLPFATFRSMFVAFGNTDSDAVQSDVAGPEHVLGSWKSLPGREFLVYRIVESYHLTKSPDIRLEIQEA